MYRCSQALLRCGANPTLRNEWGYVALHFAAMRPETGCLEALMVAPLQHTPSCLNATDNEGHVPLALAVYYKRTDQVIPPSYRRALVLDPQCGP